MNRLFFPVILAFTLALSDPLLEYREGAIIGVASHAPTQTWIAQTNTYTGGGMVTYPPGEWHTLDMSDWLPKDTKAVFVNTVLIITHGRKETPCSLGFYVRNHGDTTIDWGPAAQAFAAAPGDGTRHNYSDFVPVTNGKFDFKWLPSTQGMWPEDCAYGLAIRVSAYVR